MKTEDRRVTLGLIQSACGADAGKNLARTVAAVRQAARRGARIVCTQELFDLPYFCVSEDHANFSRAVSVHAAAPAVRALSALARELRIVLIGCFFEKERGRVYYNTAVVIDANGRFMGKYRKSHIPYDPLFYEKFYFTPGNGGLPVFRTRYGVIGVFICWDQWFPEPARLAALAGAEILFFPSAIGGLSAECAAGARRDHDAWETVQRSHAIANGVFVASINRIGLEQQPGRNGRGIRFWGGSFVADPAGTIMRKASQTREEVLLCTIDRSRIAWRRREWPFFRDRRPELYSGIVE